MRRTMMSKEELKRRYNYEDALILTIEKWKRLGYKEVWNILNDSYMTIVGGIQYLHSGTCGLCRKYGHICRKCPLNRCSDLGHPWSKAIEAVMNHDRPRFMKARRNLLRRLERAYARGER